MKLGFGESLIAKGSFDNYDLYLVKLKNSNQVVNGNYKLISFMKVQFFFENSGGPKWTADAKKKFVNDWQSAVKSAWGNHVLKTLSNGKRITLDFRFETQIEGVMWDHWEITVRSIPAGSFAVSSVRDAFINNVTLDTEDFGGGGGGGGQSQRGAVHEFGHMLGLDDEYKKRSRHKNDYRSIMNSGETVLNRHTSRLMHWLALQMMWHQIK